MTTPQSPRRRDGKRPPAAIVMMPVPPLPGERRKSSSLVMAVREYRSKWWHIRCMGEAQKCRRGECIHVGAVGRTYKNTVCKPREGDDG